LSTGCPSISRSEPEPTDLLEEATTRARQLDPDAIVYQASGVNGTALDGTGSRTLLYTFLAIDPDDGDVTHELTYDGDDWTTGTYPFPMLGMGYYDLREVDLTETQARTILADEGYEDDFHGWALYRPLHPSSLNALYTFNYSNEIVMIDTQTQEVTATTVDTEPPLLGTAPGEDSVSLQMIAAADAQIKESARSAFIVWAGGRDGDGLPLDEAADTNVWDFVAVALNGSDVPAWQLTYDGEWTVQQLQYPPFGIEFLDLNLMLTMDVVEAWSLAVDAGFDPPYGSWETFKPLNPSAEHVIYVFTTSQGFVIVDSVTGEVELEANCCVVDGCYGHCNQ
ncbi:MAG: hypothetical protein GY842_17580, partial [bacterium]|nr:hypothetical protein [bacterium]